MIKRLTLGAAGIAIAASLVGTAYAQHASDVYVPSNANVVDLGLVMNEGESARGDDKRAFQNFIAFHRIYDQALNLPATASSALLAGSFYADNRDLRISKLSAENAANEARLSSANNQVILLSLIVGLVIAALVIAMLVLRTVSRSRAAIKAVNERLIYAMQHDGLTKLFSRDHFGTLHLETLEMCRRTGKHAVLIFIDLDRFKQVNDVYGHGIGDMLLTQVAARFREAVGEAAAIGRLGGDEFGMLLPPGTDIKDADALAQKIIALVSKSYSISDFEVSIGASIGLTRLTGEDTTSASMTNADLALYEAKRNGRGTCVIYKESMRNKLEERSMLESDLAVALENGQMSVVYQPIIAGKDRSVVAYEALMRWNHPVRGVVPPGVFIPIAEDALLIESLGTWMLRTACAEAAEWPEHIKLTMNISTLQLSNPAFLGTMAHALATTGLAPERLILEVTESLIIGMADELDSLLVSLKRLGVSLALDDFGRGYSSLNYIEKMHFAMIKIDREFVQAAAAGSVRSQAVVTAIVSLANSLNVDVTAEGIEEEEQAATMLSLGCSCLQGFYFARPEAVVEQGMKGVESPARKSAAA